MTGNNMKAEFPAHEWSSDIPSMLEETVNCYKNFVAANGKGDHTAKSFRDYHLACRSALAHLEQLMRLSNLTDEDTMFPAGADENVDRLIARAQTALGSNPINNEEDR